MSIEALATSILENLKSISQAETVIGKPIESGGKVIVPVSKVSMGFGLSGNEGKSSMSASGGGLKVEPIAFLVVTDDEVKLLPVGKESSALTKALELIPEVVEKFSGSKSKKEED